MTADLKKMPSVGEWQEKIARDSENACRVIRERASEAMAMVREYVATIGSVQRVSDVIAAAEVAVVNDVVIPATGMGGGIGFRSQIEYDHRYLLQGPSHDVVLKPGKKRVMLFIVPIEE